MADTDRLLSLGWTDDPEANRLVAQDPLAFLIGFCLDQQFPIERAFLGPLAIRERLGTLTPPASPPPTRRRSWRSSASLRPSTASRPAWPSASRGSAASSPRPTAGTHPPSGARRERRRELLGRLRDLPGYGPLKASIVVGCLARHFGVRPAGWELIAPDFPTLADVVTSDERRAYQAAKRAHKASMRASAGHAQVRG